MQFFETIDTYSFRYNGKKFVKNFIVMPVGAEAICVYNAFDSRMQFLPATHFSEVSVDGTVFNSQTELIAELAPKLFAKQIVDIGSISAETPTLQEVHDASLDNDLSTCRVNTYTGIQFYYSEGDSTSVITPEFVMVSPDHFNSSYSIQDKGFFYNRASFNVGITFEEVPNSLVYNRYFNIPSTEIEVNGGIRTLATREWVAENTPLPSLQNVLDVGNVASTYFELSSGPLTAIYSFGGVDLGGPAGGLSINVNDGLLSVNTAGNKQCQLNFDGLRLQTNAGDYATLIQNSTTTNAGIILNTPNANEGIYTLATEEYVQDQLGGIGSITSTSELINDGDGSNPFATTDLIPTNTSQLANDGDGSASFVLSYEVQPVGYSGSFNDLSDLPDFAYQTDLDNKVDILKQIKTVTGTTYTLQAVDRKNIVHFTSTSAVTLTIPTGLTANSRFEFKQLGAGQVTVTGSGTTIRVAASEQAKSAEQYSVFALDWIGNNEYLLYGRLSLA